MKKASVMYNDLRKYLSPLIAYDLVKVNFPKCSLGVMDFEFKRLKGRYKNVY